MRGTNVYVPYHNPILQVGINNMTSPFTKLQWRSYSEGKIDV